MKVLSPYRKYKTKKMIKRRITTIILIFVHI